ncbi:Uncharacterised protein [Yersinia enterocolitica]|nr:Uncharacterised protein [Yersinia enterocolitica]
MNTVLHEVAALYPRLLMILRVLRHQTECIQCTQPVLLTGKVRYRNITTIWKFPDHRLVSQDIKTIGHQWGWVLIAVAYTLD